MEGIKGEQQSILGNRGKSISIGGIDRYLAFISLFAPCLRVSVV